MKLHKWTNKETDGPWIHHGRAHAYLYWNDEHSHIGIGCELVTGHRSHFGGLRLKVGGKHSENFLSGMVGVPRLVTFYWSIEAPRNWYRFSPSRSQTTELVVSRLDGSSALSVWLWKHDDGSWRRSDSWWQRRHWYINLNRLLWGKPNRTETVLSVTEAKVPMPEANYPATVTLTKTVSRFRFGHTVVRHSYEIEFPEGVYIPVPGKGSTSYNCGPDGIFSSYGPGRSVGDAIASVVKSALNERIRYAGTIEYADPIS